MRELKFIQACPDDEIWKPVKDYEDFYEVSNLGNIRTIERYVVLPTHKYLKKQKQLTQFTDGRGYYHVKLYNGEGKPKSLTTHRVVASTFHQNPDNLPEINHKDSNKLNNREDNLEWCTKSDNIKHAYKFRDPSTYKGSGNKNSKLTEANVLELREEYSKNKTPYRILADKYGVGITLIGYIINRNTWRHV